MMKWISIVAALMVTQGAFAKGKIQNEDVKSLSELTTAGGSMSQLINDSKIYVTANSINQQLSTAISSGLIGGGGSSTGIQLLQNPGFEVGVSTGWSNTGGTFTAVSTGSNLLVGQGSATYQSTGSGQFMQSSLYAIPNGLKSRSCIAQILYKGADANYILEAVDGSSNILASTPMYASSVPNLLGVTFQCPSSGSIRLKIVSIASGAIMALDQMFLGENVLTQVSQAVEYGSALTPLTTGCVWNQSSLGSTDSVFPPNASCPTPTVTGYASAPATKIPGITFASLPPGHYQIFATSLFYISATNDQCVFSFTDGTNSTVGGAVIEFSNAASTPHIVGELDYTTAQSNITLQLQARGLSSSNCTVDPGTSTGLLISVYRYPTDSEIVVRPENNNWRVQYNNILAYPPLSSTTVASNVAIPAASAGTGGGNVNTGTLLAYSPCFGSEAPAAPGNNCTASAELGVSYIQPSSGDVEVCADFTVNGALAANSELQQTFTVSQTQNDDDSVILQSGAGVGQSYFQTNTVGNTTSNNVHTCNQFHLSAAGLTTFRLYYQQQLIAGPASGMNIVTDNAFGGRTAYWSIRPLTQNLPAPVFVGAVTQPSSGVEVMTHAFLDQGGSNCISGACTIERQNGNWLNNITRSSTGFYSIVINPGVFSSTPDCIVSGLSSAYASVPCFATMTDATTGSISCYNFSGVGIDALFTIMCMGPK